MHALGTGDTIQGISAVMQPGERLDCAVLDLAAVLEGLVGDSFEIVVVSGACETKGVVDELRARAPGLPLRLVKAQTIAAGCDSARYDLILVSAADGQFDVRQLNRLMDAIEQGADVAAGYRPRLTDGIFRQLQRWGWKVDVDCAFKLFRQAVWQHVARSVAASDTRSCATLLRSVRRLGYRVTEVPVTHRRPTIDAQASAGFRAA